MTDPLADIKERRKEHLLLRLLSGESLTPDEQVALMATWNELWRSVERLGRAEEALRQAGFQLERALHSDHKLFWRTHVQEANAIVRAALASPDEEKP